MGLYKSDQKILKGKAPFLKKKIGKKLRPRIPSQNQSKTIN